MGFRDDGRANKRIPSDPQELQTLVENHPSISAAARAIGVAPTTLNHRLKRLRASDYADPLKTENLRSVESTDPKEWSDIRKLIKSRGVNPDDFTVSRVRVNEWGDGNKQLRVDLVPRTIIPAPATLPSGWTPPQPVKGEKTTKGLVAFLSDQHCPNIDEGLHAGVLAWLVEHKPERVYLLGDLLDFDAVSRHKPNPGGSVRQWSATVQETIDSAFRVLADYRTATGAKTKFYLLAGNHEDRLRDFILGNAPQLHDLRPADPRPDEAPLMSSRQLLRLDELNITMLDSPDGPYSHGYAEVIPDNLAAIHGSVTKKGSGASALQNIERWGTSVFCGHTHKQAIVFSVQHPLNGPPVRRVGVEVGCLCKTVGGLGYTVRPDWSSGFASVTLHNGGRFHADLATWVEGKTLLWRDWSYTHKEAV